MSLTTAPDTLLAELRGRGVRFDAIRYRRNRTVLLSVSRDGSTLNSHECFRDAPAGIVDAIAAFLAAPRGGRRARSALATIRGWDGTRRGLARARASKPRAKRRRPPAPAELSALFQRLNGGRFGGRLPEIPLRVSRRMTRTLGKIAYEPGGVAPDGPRSVREIVIASDLLEGGNEAVLRDTLLHEMAHAEAWLSHGHRGHGRVWRTVAKRVGCTPRALIRERVRGRR